MAKKNYWDEPWTLERAKRSEQWINSDFLRVMHEIRCIWDKSKGETAGKKKIQECYSLASHYIEEYEHYFRYLFRTEEQFTVLSVRLGLRGLAGVDSCFGGILKLIPDIESYFGDGYNDKSIWHICLDALAHRDDWSQMLECWRKVRDGGEVPQPDWPFKVERNAKGALTPESSRYFYSFLHDKPEFDLFVHIMNRYTPESSAEDGYLESRDLATYAEALCLYIALRNEQNKLKEEAELYGIPLEKETKPKPEEKPQLSVDQWVNLPLGEKRKSEEWKDVFTEQATRIYGIAIGERKIMQGNGLGYEWTYGAPNPPSPTHLAFFLLLVYNFKDNIPWKKLQILFWPKFDKADKKGETHVGRVLRGRADQLRKRTDWYKHNINKLWGFKYTDFPPHFPTWAQEIYLYVSKIENELAAKKKKSRMTKNS